MYPSAGTHQRLPAEQSHWHPSTTLEERVSYNNATPTNYQHVEYGQPATFDTIPKSVPQYASHDRYAAAQQYPNYETSAESQSHPPQQLQVNQGAPHWKSHNAITPTRYQQYYGPPATRGSSDFGGPGASKPQSYYGEPPAAIPTEAVPYYYKGEEYQGANSWYQDEEVQMSAAQEARVGNEFAMPQGSSHPVGAINAPPAAHQPQMLHTVSPGSVEGDPTRIAAMVPQFSPNSSNPSPNSEHSVYAQQQQVSSPSTAPPPPTHNPTPYATSSVPQQHPSSSHMHPGLIRRRSHDMDAHIGGHGPPQPPSPSSALPATSSSSSSTGLGHPSFGTHHHHHHHHHLLPQHPPHTAAAGANNSTGIPLPHASASPNSLLQTAPQSLPIPNYRSSGPANSSSSLTQSISHYPPCSSSDQLRHAPGQAPYPKVEDFDYYATGSSQYHPKPSARVVTQIYGLETRAKDHQKAYKGSQLMSRSHGALPLFPDPAQATQRTAPTQAPPVGTKTGPTQFQFHPSPYMAYMDPPLKQSGQNAMSHSHSSPSLPHDQKPINTHSPINMSFVTSPTSLERTVGDDLEQYATNKRMKWTESDQSPNHAYISSNHYVPTPSEEDTPDTSSDTTTTSYWTPHT